MPDLESNLRETFERHARSISPPAHTGDALVSAIMHRRRRRTATIYAATLAPAAVVAAVAAFAFRPASDGTDLQATPHTTDAPTASEPAPTVPLTPAPQPTTTQPAAPATWPPSAPLSMGGVASCVEEYSTTTLTNRAFGFDGTVVAVRGATEPEFAGDLVNVDFTVNEWFRGGEAPTASVSMFNPGTLTSVDQAGLDGWTVGSRLLVSGEPRWGGEPLDAAVAWYCGFSRSYDPDTAATWRAVLADDESQP